MGELALMIPIVGSIGMFACIAFIVAVTARSRQRQAELRAEVQSRLIDKFSSAPEIVTFLQSPEGKHFLGGIESMPAMTARDRIIRTMSKAVVLSLLGVGFLACCIWPETRNEGFFIAGCILLALGVGYFLSALVSLKLSRNWGLMEPADSVTSHS
jgi:hypothetical protein